MNVSSRHAFILCSLLFFLVSCASLNARKTAQTEIIHAQQQIPEHELLDVGLTVFESNEITEKKAKKEGTNPDVRRAENHFIPYHLKNTLEQSGHWGMVRVTPIESDSADVLVKGEVLESNGENLILNITVSDSSGGVWLRKKYKATVTEKDFKNLIPGQKDAFQGVYNTISNDMANYLKKLDPDEIKKISAISTLKFARDFAPSAFEGYLEEDTNGKITLNRLPADNDTMMERLIKKRERVYMFEDIINEYYEGFYNDMWPSYENWRTLNLTERIALNEQKRSALMQQAGGALLVALGILAGMEGGDNAGIVTGGLVIIGGQIFLSGLNVSKQAKMHYEALEELGESFGSEMKPIVMEFEGKKYELTGTVEEQYKRWRELLHEIYYAETGFTPPEDVSDQKNSQEP
ncbi:MAG: hypothetical protein MRJ65_08105 [Candidatus Brocadiaceae bacterium]|nr:hypothetical protein [Candidatus Brocadiaceae bacterium]